ncbi:undecaprenyl-phosphate glucose phosphotransferase [Ammoniphilus sp. CFH 90114]|uniref:undecaprenyl-phosphate glucose phosphotransferase n=1 Tax=Ammoniphilus sp. CFH 90114 TaxID=2493665 RepID=UPI00100E2B44|nr:undecaprenyl-phosphate glucose phosphotransferase [Ammoniphilus sp. CFH 90114]RXT04502.1 undecaprenyl-phosphate glucose phosphotransferase [Ammoniphilus sp. CFH 90114]
MVRGKEKFLTQTYALTDFLMIQVSFVLAWVIKFELDLFTYEPHLGFLTYGFWAGVYGAFAIASGYLFSLYVPKRKKKFAYEIGKAIQVHFISMLFLLSFLFLYKEVDISRAFLAIFLGLNITLILGLRLALKLSLKKFRAKGYNKQFILILGAGHLGRKFHDNVGAHPELGFEVIGFLDDYVDRHQCNYKNKYKPILGKVDQLAEVLAGERLVDEVVIALPLRAHEKYKTIIEVCEKAGVKALIIPDFYSYLPAQPSFDSFADMPLINVREIPLDEISNRVWKRTFDIVFSLAAIILTLPFLIMIVLGIKLTSPGPIIFKQERIGLNRRPFMMYKFRSMHVSNSKVSDTVWTTENDPRKTKFGSFLRKTSLDELPQFFNVLKGDMSVVGPRPERPYFVDQFKEDIPKYMIKHHVRPGITGWAQANGLRGDTSIEDRIVHDIFYIENWTLLFDMKIIWKTIVNGLINKNAY